MASIAIGSGGGRFPAALRRRLAAIAALALGAAALALAIAVAIVQFPRGLTVAAALIGAGAAGWYGLRRRGLRRQAGIVVAAILLVAAVVAIATEGRPLLDALVMAGFVAAFAAARVAFQVRAPLPQTEPTRHPVLFYNPRSGGGKATRFHLVEEAAARGIEAIELGPGQDLEQLVRQAAADGATSLAMAGGDGSQAVVATIAAELGLPYSCIPAGTRNHFALDLGVDRDDVPGALDALVAGRERLVDLAEINGRVFVNNVSLGIYGEAVQRAGYREAKIRTLLDTLPDVVGPEGEAPYLRWTDGDGHSHSAAALIVVSNNPYRLGRVLGMGGRPRLDTGLLGIAVADFSGAGSGRLQAWSVDELVVEAREGVWAGVDGEAIELEPPLRFRSHPRVLRVLIAPHHPGASPTSVIPDNPSGVVPALFAAARGHEPVTPFG